MPKVFRRACAALAGLLPSHPSSAQRSLLRQSEPNTDLMSPFWTPKREVEQLFVAYPKYVALVRIPIQVSQPLLKDAAPRDPPHRIE